MLARDDLQAANDNSLNREAALSLRLLHWFLESREGAIAELIGPDYRPDPLRDELMRLVCLNFAEGQARSLRQYQDDLISRWTNAAIEEAVDALSSAHLVMSDPKRDVERRGLIWPTKRLVSFYNTQMPELLEVAVKILRGVVPTAP